MENKRTYRIAVVDDDVIIRTLIGTLFLEVDVFEIAYFESGESFIESFNKVEYDAIILDHDFDSENAGDLS
jgi:FixJ family two-component response regulator